MNNDRRTFLDGSIAPRKPLTEAKMIKYPADLEHKNHRDMTPAEKQRWIAYNRAYNQAVSNQDFSGIETSPSLGTKSKEYQDAWKVWNKQRIKHGANRDFHLIKPFVAPKEKTKKTKGGKKPYFMDYPNKYEEVTTEAKPLLVEYQTPEREQMQMKELQRLQTIARAKAKAWDTRSGNPKSRAQEAAFDAAVDKLSAEVRDAENERRWEKVIDKDGKDKRPSAALLKQLAPQRAAQLKRDAEDNAGAWVGTAQFDRDSNKASIIIDEIKKGLARAKTTKKESVTTKDYKQILENAKGIMKPVTEAKDAARLKHNAAILKAAGVKTINQLMAKKVKQPILDREISEFVERLSAKQIILLKKLLANGGGVRGGYQGGNQIGNDYPGQYGNQGGNQIGNY